MDISGSYTLNAPREQVWNALLDPDLLRRAIPGCESLEQSGENQYAMRLTIAVAGVKGVYQGTLRLLDAQKPVSYRAVVDGAGARGIVHSDGVLRLETNAAGATDIHYAGQAQLGGAIASLGAQVAQGAGNMLVREYFRRMADLLPATSVAPAVVAPAVPFAVTPEPPIAASLADETPASAPAAAMPEPVAEALTTLTTPATVDAFMPPPTAPIHTPHPPVAGATDAAPSAATLAAAPAPPSTPRPSDARPIRPADGSPESQRRSAGFIGVVIAVVAVLIVVAVILIVTGR